MPKKRENFFTLLKLDLEENNTKKIEEAIDRFRKEQNRLKTGPLRVKAEKNLARIEEMKDVMLDAWKRKEEADKLRKKMKEREYELAESIQKIGNGGTISKDQATEIVKMFKKHFGESKIKDKDNEIRGIHTDSKTIAKRDLVGKCRTYLMDEERRKRYDNSLDKELIDNEIGNLLNVIRIRGGGITPEDYKEILNKVSKLKVDPTITEFYIEDFAKKYKIKLDRGNESYNTYNECNTYDVCSNSNDTEIVASW